MIRTGHAACAALVGIVLSLFDSRSGSYAAELDKASLYSEAKKEATVTIWATNAEDINWIPKYFAKEYPGIAVRIVTDLNVASRLIMEDRAKRHDADVVWNSEALVAPLIERKLVTHPDWSKFGLRASDVSADGYMAYTSSVTFVVAYNKNLVRDVDIPSKWDQLLDSKYHGKMAASPFLMARLCAALGVYQGEEKLSTFASRLRSESSVLWTNDLLEQVLARGERPFVVATAIHFADRWIASGRPFGYSIPEPVFVTQFGSIVMRDAPHPSAARLLSGWLSSPSGKRAREEAIFGIDLGPTSGHPKAVELRASGKKIYFDDATARKRRNILIPKMDRVLSGLQ